MNRTFSCLTIMVTNQCPLQCAHCGPMSGPMQKGALGLDVVERALDEALRRSCQVVNFSGGEPFILGQTLVKMIRASSERGLLSRITTGAYWSGTPEDAKRRLIPLASAGLNQLFISTSDAHRVDVPLKNVIEATRAARSLGIEVYLVLGISKTSDTSSRTLRRAFDEAGVGIPGLIESPIIPYGRAAENISPRDLLLRPVEDFAGPCPSLTEHPTIRPDGQVTGCAVVFGQECSALNYGYIQDEEFSTILDRMQTDPLARWIHNIGVVELKRYLEVNTPLRFADSYVNICHLCGDILGNKDARVYIDALRRRTSPARIESECGGESKISS
jgi:Radical SAM superfamily